MAARRSVVVTGTSTGIGWACVKVLVASGFHVFGSVRKQADAERLSKEFGANFTPLIFDVTDEAAVAAAANMVEAVLDGVTLFGLVNNAGITVPGPLLYLKVDDFRHQIAVNLTGPLIVTQAFAPLLGADRARQGAPGRIVMIMAVRRSAPNVHSPESGQQGSSTPNRHRRRQSFRWSRTAARCIVLSVVHP